MNYSEMSESELEALMLELQAEAEALRDARIAVKEAWSAARSRKRLARLAGLPESVVESADQELVDGLLALYSARASEAEGSVTAKANTLSITASAPDSEEAE
jgi:hypothetical protein